MENSDLPRKAGSQPQVVHLEPGSYAWCTCGLSEKQPFCDGKHRGTSYHSHKFTITSAKDVALCMCKKSGNPPFCDGSHAKD